VDLEPIWNRFGTRLEQAWNIVGTIYIDYQRVTRMRGTSVEHAWNLGGDLGEKKTPSRDGALIELCNLYYFLNFL